MAWPVRTPTRRATIALKALSHHQCGGALPLIVAKRNAVAGDNTPSLAIRRLNFPRSTSKSVRPIQHGFITQRSGFLAPRCVALQKVFKTSFVPR